jgi:hypothetical protein
MPHRANTVRCLLALAAVALFAATSLAAGAQASVGELGRFGKAGTALGSLEEPTTAIGVNPANNSVFVVDDPKNEGEFRIQEFTGSAGHYTGVASASFKPEDSEVATTFDKIEGVAVDPEAKRVYVLAAEERPTCEEELFLKKECKFLYQENFFAASAIYAFSTEPSGSELVPAAGTTKGLLIGPGKGKFEPQSDSYGVPLLNPTGITVDPTTHELIVLGAVNKGKNSETVEEEIGGKTIKRLEGEESTVALQRVTEKGALAEKYVEPEIEQEPGSGKEDFFQECGCVQSPVVTSTGSVLVASQESGVYEIASPFSKNSVPKVKIEPFPNTPLITFPRGAEEGGSLAIGEEGTLFSLANIKLQEKACGADCQHFPGIMEFKPSLEEDGYTGGQSERSGNGKCDIPVGAATVAAGKEGDVFVLSPSEESPTIIEFGPGGTGCPGDSVAAPIAKVGGVTVPEDETIPISDEVALESTLTQANGKSVEWEFGDGTHEKTKPGRGTQVTAASHKFTRTGQLTVTETVETNDLAEPSVTVTRKIAIAGAPVVVTGKASEVTPESAKLSATVNPENSTLTECTFEYGLTPSYGSKAPCEQKSIGGTSAVEVTAKIAGLSSATPYDFRISATNGISKEKHALGAEAKFETQKLEPGKPTGKTLAATLISQTTAELNGSVDPVGKEITRCEFRYGTTEAFGSSVPCEQKPGSGYREVAVSAKAGGLSANSGYHYELVVENGDGAPLQSTGVQSFTTKPEESKVCVINCGGTTTTTTTTTTTQSGGSGVLPSIEEAPPVVTVTGSSTVASTGAFTLKLSCPAAESSCSGSLTVRTLTPKTKKHKSKIVVVATGTFTIVGGHVLAVALHLSKEGRSLLSQSHSLRAGVIIVAHNAKGATNTGKTTLVLKPAPSKKKKKH